MRDTHSSGERSSFTLKPPLQALESRNFASGERVKDESERVNGGPSPLEKLLYRDAGHGPPGPFQPAGDMA